MTKQKMLPVLKEMRKQQWRLWEFNRSQYHENPSQWREELRDEYEMRVRALDQVITEMEDVQ